MTEETLSKANNLITQIKRIDGDIDLLKRVIDHGVSTAEDYQIGIIDKHGVYGVGIAHQELLIIAPILLKAAYQKHAKLKKEFAEL